MTPFERLERLERDLIEPILRRVYESVRESIRELHIVQQMLDEGCPND
jgi:hypothetical protein